MVRFHRLPDNDWGLKFENETPVVGQRVRVTTRSGRNASVTVGAVFENGPGYTITKIDRGGSKSAYTPTPTGKEEEMQTTGTRKCRTCSRRLPISNFAPYGSNKRRWECDECRLGVRRDPTPTTSATPATPITKWCPNHHGSFTYRTDEEYRTSGGRCPQCNAVLQWDEPEPAPAPVPVTQLKNIPELPAIHHEILPKVISAVLAGKHVYLSGTPGTGKSMIGKQVADVLGRPFYGASCTQTASEAKFTGFILPATGKVVRTPFREAFENGGVFQLDEADHAHPNVLGVLNEALSNGRFAFPDGMVEANPGFICFATANTWGHGPNADFVGALKLDPATLDRFVRIYVDVDEKLESLITLAAAENDESIAEEALRVVRSLRRTVERDRIKVFVTPRASMQVAALMIQGWTVRDAVMTTAIGTLEPERVEQLMENVGE